MSTEPLAIFDGATYEPHLDRERLASLLQAVRAAMSDGHWHTLAELQTKVGGSEASVSARLRDLRKPRFGGRTIERERVGGSTGLHRYRMVT